MAAQGFKLAEMFAEVSIKGLPKVATQMGAVRSLFNSTSASLTGGLAAALSRAENGFGGLQRITSGASSAMFGIMNTGRGASKALDGVSGLLAKTGTGTGNLVTFLSGLRASMSGTAQVTSGFGQSFAGMLTVLRSGGGALAALSVSAFGVGRSLMSAASLPVGAGFQRMFSAARSAVGSFASGASSALSGFRSAVGSTLSAVRSAAGGIGSSFMSIIPKLFSLKGALVAVGLAIGAVAAPVQMASGMESQLVAFKTMLGDAEKAKTVMSDVMKFAAETPYELPELTGATKKMLAFGSSDKTVVNELRMIGDVASGVTAPIGEIAEIYGKARVQGRLFSEDVNQFTGRGIPIIQELAKQFGVSDSQVKKLVEDGKVGFPALEQAFQSMTGKGGKFHDMMKEQSKTAGGLWSTLMDNIKSGFRGLGEAMLPGIKKVMAALIDLSGAAPGFDGMKEAIAGVSDWIGDKLVVAINAAKSAFPYLQAYGSAVASAFRASGEMIQEAGAALWELMSPLRELMPSVESLGDGFMKAMDGAKFFYDNWRLFMAIGVEEAKLFVSNSWEHIKTFFDNCVVSLEWFGDNWKDVFTGMWEYTKTIFANMGKNIGEFFYLLSTGRAFQFTWTPLEEGFKTTLKSWPKYVEAALRESSPELDRLYDEMGRRWGERSGRAASGEMTATSGMSETERRLRAEQEQAGKAAGSTATGKIERFGLEEFAKHLQKGVTPRDKTQEKIAANSDKQVAALDAIQGDIHKVAERNPVPVYG